jgi:L-seryl-tRNA(Ser) seleniumtransferase
LVDLRSEGIHEPLVSDSFAAGMNLVSFSCDKLLGGPQCGIIAGDSELVNRVRRNPMYRALRCDKLAIEALASTLLRVLAEDWEAIPTLRMIRQPLEQIHFRAERMALRLAPLDVALRPGESAIGGGATPDQHLATWLVEIATTDAEGVERRLRRAPSPVIARLENDCVVIDLRTVDPSEEEDLIAALQTAALSS